MMAEVEQMSRAARVLRQGMVEEAGANDFRWKADVVSGVLKMHRMPSKGKIPFDFDARGDG
ncbi:hypothetical protein [Beijerinckia indica]|uniref:hypothetical protein n=1 Tax=Beijerinckia indica TaxID=533 RepID=UPI0011D0B8BE|nr:hypothetical protein [Beijerinckia indica]